MLNLSHIQQYDTQHNWQSVVMLCVIIEPFQLSDVVPLTCQPEGEWGTLDSRKVKELNTSLDSLRAVLALEHELTRSMSLPLEIETASWSAT